jgi:hypothetical protein
MGWFGSSRELTPPQAAVEICTDSSKLYDLANQLTAAAKVMDGHKEKAEQATKVVDEIMAQLRVVTDQRDRAIDILRGSQETAQAIIDGLGTIKLDMGV